MNCLVFRDDRMDTEYFGLCEVQVFQAQGNQAQIEKKKYMFKGYLRFFNVG